MDADVARTRVTKGSRLNLRATADEKRILEQAAEITHVTASQFVMRAALRSAEEVLGDQNRFSLPPQEWDAFVRSLDRPARVIPALQRAATKPSPFSDR